MLVSFVRLPLDMVLMIFEPPSLRLRRLLWTRQLFDDDVQVGTRNIALKSYKNLVLARPVRRQNKMSHCLKVGV